MVLTINSSLLVFSFFHHLTSCCFILKLHCFIQFDFYMVISFSCLGHVFGILTWMDLRLFLFFLSFLFHFFLSTFDLLVIELLFCFIWVFLFSFNLFFTTKYWKDIFLWFWHAFILWVDHCVCTLVQFIYYYCLFLIILLY